MKEKAINLRRALSFVLAVILSVLNLCNPVMVFAEETDSENSYSDEIDQSTANSETEQAVYHVVLPYLEGCLYAFDQTHLYLTEEQTQNQEQDIILQYHQGEKIEIEILTSDQYEVTELHLYNQEAVLHPVETVYEEPAYTWNPQTGKLEFFMPEEDIFLKLAILEKEVQMQSTTEELHAGDTAEQEQTQPEMILVQQELSEGENTVMEPESQEISSQEESDTALQTDQNTMPETEAYQMVIEMDGQPTQGSIIQMETLTIPFDTWEFDPENDFTNITFSPEEYDITYISDDINYVVPGVYSSIYRVQQKDTERMWYALRPIRVSEENASSELDGTGESETQDGQSENTSEQSPADQPDSEEPASENVTEPVVTSFDLYKVNADNQEEKLEGIHFRMFSSSDQEAEKARQIAEAVESLREEQQAEIYAANTEAATALGKLLQECDAEAETIRSEYAEKLQKYQEKEHTEEEISAFQTANDAELEGKLSEKRKEHETKILSLLAEQKEALKAMADENSSEIKALEEKLVNELQISDDQLLGEDLVTDVEGHFHREGLTAGATYFLYETGTIPGFNLDTNKYEFRVDENGLIEGKTNYTLTITNQPNHVQFSKRTSEGEELPGASMEIISIGEDGAETVVESWVSEDKPHMISKLPEGNYTLVETAAPDGFAIAATIPFTVTNSLETQNVVMVDDQLTVHISKKDAATDQELPGAEMAVLDDNGTVVEQWISTTEEHTANIPAGHYALTEITAPDGYTKAGPVYFTISSQSKNQSITMYNSPKAQVNLLKQDADTKNAVEGALLALYDSNQKEIEKWTTGTEAHQTKLDPGTYVLKEETAPSAYATADDLTFTVAEDGYKEVQTVVMYDKALKVGISKKDLITDEALAGAKLVLKDKEKKVVKEWVSRKQAEEIPVERGTYTLTEVTAPNGYEVAETMTFEVEDKQDIQEIILYNTPKEQLIDLTGKKKEITSSGTTQVSSGSQQPAVSGNSGGNYISNAVRTGDFNRYLIPVILVLAGAVFGVIFIVTGKKKKKG